MIRVTCVLVALTAACGASPHPSSPAAPTCEAVAAHLVDLAEQDNQAAAAPHLATGMRAELTRQCTDAPWSTARRACLLAAPDQDATLACPAE